MFTFLYTSRESKKNFHLLKKMISLGVSVMNQKLGAVNPKLLDLLNDTSVYFTISVFIRID